MEITLQSLLTVVGSTSLVLILVQLLKTTVPSFDSARFGAISAVGLGIATVGLANIASVADVRLGIGEAVLTGILAGASASGLYSAVTNTARAFEG